MVRIALRVLGVGLLVGILAAAGGLAWAHLAIRRERPSLPDLAAIESAIAGADAPVRLWLVNTASQPMPRSSVLDPARDPSPDAPYVMSHPAFLFEWADGRLLAVDSGMTRDDAIAFGRPLESLGGAQPIRPLGSLAEHLAGDARSRLRGAVFTHLHSDHVGGMVALCEGPVRPVRVFMTEAQADRPNYTTRPGLRLLETAPCAEIVRLEGPGAASLPGYPGVGVVRAGGHTPGSQIVVARVAGERSERHYVLTGDIVNAIDGLRADVPKPLLYRLLVVPEDEERQRELRTFLRSLEGAGYSPLVSHDQLALEAAGVEAWPETPTDRR